MIYYKLSNGEDIGIEYTNQEIKVTLFGGSTVLSYSNNIDVLLNDIIEEIEVNYKQLKIEDWNFGYSCYTD